MSPLYLLGFALLAPTWLPQPATEPVPAFRAARKQADRALHLLVTPVEAEEHTPEPIFVNISGKQVLMEEKPSPAAGAGKGRVRGWRKPLGLRELAFARANFDRMVFSNDRDTATRRATLGARLDWQINVIARTRPLTPADREALRQAGTGDIQRFFNRVEAARAEFESTRQDYDQGWATMRQFDLLARDFEGGPFGPGSLFFKTLTRRTMGALVDPLRLGAPGGSPP